MCLWLSVCLSSSARISHEPQLHQIFCALVVARSSSGGVAMCCVVLWRVVVTTAKPSKHFIYFDLSATAIRRRCSHSICDWLRAAVLQRPLVTSHCKKYPYSHGHFMASFPHFNGTGSVYVCIRKSTKYEARARHRHKIFVDIRIFLQWAYYSFWYNYGITPVVQLSRCLYLPKSLNDLSIIPLSQAKMKGGIAKFGYSYIM